MPGAQPRRPLRPGQATEARPSEQVADEAKIVGYALLDVQLGHEGVRLGAARFQPFLKVSNLLDTRYNGSVIVNAFGGRYFEPAPAPVRAGLNVRL